MKKFYLTCMAIIFLMILPPAKANDSALIKSYLLSEISKGRTQAHFAQKLDVSEATVSLFLNNKITTSPKLLRNFKSKLPKTYKKLTTPKKTTKKKIIKKSLVVKRLDFGKEEPVKAKPINLVKEAQEVTKHLLNKPSQLKDLRLNRVPEESSMAPIVIAFREEGNGKGAFFDHFTVQKATQYPTVISADPRMRLKSLNEHVRGITYNLKYGAKKDGRIIPEVSENFSEMGLLFIPGRIRDNEFDPIRREHENYLLKQALLRGQPILAVCAGSWRLWEALGGKLEEVTDHCYGGGMIRLSERGKIGYNKQIHRIEVESNTLLETIMKIEDETDKPSVNSLHWKAPSSKKIPALAKISAKAVLDDEIAPQTRQGTQMNPESDTIEAFESRYGAPFLGIQWHPEAYTSSDDDELSPEKHKAILEFMAKAGQAYHHKRAMLKELEDVMHKN